MTEVMTDKTIMPKFVFIRNSAIEREGGYVLAGDLVVNERKPKHGKSPPRRVQLIVRSILERLAEMAGETAVDDVLVGWPAGDKPENAANIDLVALMRAWAKDRLTIGVRVDPRNDGLMRFDSDILRHMGVGTTH
jgi:hypothetical protein